VAPQRTVPEESPPECGGNDSGADKEQKQQPQLAATKTTEALEESDSDEEDQTPYADYQPLQFFPNYDGTEESTDYDTARRSAADRNPVWRDEAYWRLPENVRHAIDVAKLKSKHSDFWYRLQTMNDKLFVFRSVFYGAVPQYQRVFLEKKRKALEDKLKEEKALFEKEMNAMSSKARRKMLKKHPEMMKTAVQSTAPNKYQDFKGRDGSGLNELRGLSSLEQTRGSGVTAQQMIDNLRIRKRIAPVEPPRGLNVKSRYLSTLSAKPEAKRANSTTDATQVRRGSLASSGHSRSRPGPLVVNPKAEKPSFDVAAAHRIKEADEQDETMTPMPKRYANRLEAKQAYAAQREE
jgi:hypothetical protein